MKVLKNNYNANNSKDMFVDTKGTLPPYPRKLICNSCESELEYGEEDLRMGTYGAMFVDCPCCGYDNMLEENEHSIILTKDNVEFPTHFHRTSVQTGAVDCCNDSEIKQCIKQAIEYFRNNKEQYSWSTQYGNLYVRVDRHELDESYDVVVSNDFYTTYIPFESEDYSFV